jgi:Sulfotransferase domain
VGTPTERHPITGSREPDLAQEELKMPLDVIGAGFGRTGTLSLKRALERLGFVKCYHMMEVSAHPEHVAMWAAAHRGEPVDWELLYRGYRATVDWPSCNLWREHAVLYPNAKVILSTRDPDSWYTSVMTTIYPASTQQRNSDNPMMQRFGEWIYEIVWKGVFDGRIEDRAYAIGVYNAHVERVKAALPKSRLLVFEAKQGWEPLCRFLGVATPDEPYPRVNSSEDFLVRSAGRKS